jgi:tetratricopeptide (TPR) repeat protein
MKTLFIATLIAAAAFVVGWRFSAMEKLPALSSPAVVLKPRTPAPVAATVPPPRPASGDVRPTVASAPDEGVMALATALDAFTSPKASFAQRQAVLEQLRKGGQLGEAIAALKQLAAQNPQDAAVAAALGEAQISQIRTLLEAGGNPASNDIAILALQADQNFTAALAQDPANWDAQFEKAAAMSHWPAAMNKGPEVMQRLEALVTQQEASAAPQPEYAQTYALLGEQYQADGQGDKAAQIWQQGIARFPLSSALQREFASAH